MKWAATVKLEKSKKARKLASEYCLRTSAHGVSNVVSSTHVAQKVGWIIILCGAGADPRGRPRGPWPPPSDQGALDHVKSALNFGAKHIKVPQVEGKVLSIWGQKT